jgi:DNA-binding transcriptional regulator YiaG
MEKAYQSDLLGVIHEMAGDLHQIGAINSARMREYDKNCIVRKPESARDAPETALHSRRNR